MGAPSFVEEPGDGDTTKRVRSAVHSEIRVVKRIQFWVTIGLTVAGLGFFVAMWANRYAQLSDVEKVAAKQDTIADKLQEHIASESEKFGSLRQQSKNIEEDYHWQREQLSRIVDRVGAVHVPPPAPHKETP
jgi:hypothetical protein